MFTKHVNILVFLSVIRRLDFVYHCVDKRCTISSQIIWKKGRDDSIQKRFADVSLPIFVCKNNIEILRMVFEGVPLSFVQTKKRTKQFSDVGVNQFINLYRRWKDRDDDPFKWGDEVESSCISIGCTCVTNFSISIRRNIRLLNSTMTTKWPDYL